MIIKPLKPTYELLQAEALDRRLPPTHIHKERIATRARNIRAGYNGERALEFPLSFLPEEKYFILHQLRIPDEQGAFQIDTLLLSTNFILIIEVKNIRDNVIFDDMGQVFRKEENREQGFSNPVDQVNLQHLRLISWLRNFNFPSIPIEKIVIYTNPNTIIKNLTKKDELPKVVMQKEKLIIKINEFNEIHPRPRFSIEQIIDLSNHLLEADEEMKQDILKWNNINKEQLIKGIICPGCLTAPMRRKQGYWICLYCEYSSKTAHRMALVDYALLFKPYINNREAREVFQIDSTNITKKILLKERLKWFGVKSGRRYYINVEELM